MRILSFLLLAGLFLAIFISPKTEAASVTQPIKLIPAENFPPQIFTLSPCSANPTSIAGDGTLYSVSMDPSCSFKIYGQSSANVQWGFSNSGVFSVSSTSQTTCSSSPYTEIDLTYYLQYTNTFKATFVPSLSTGFGAYCMGGTSLGVFYHPVPSCGFIVPFRTLVGKGDTSDSRSFTFDASTLMSYPGYLDSPTKFAVGPVNFTINSGSNTFTVQYGANNPTSTMFNCQPSYCSTNSTNANSGSSPSGSFQNVEPYLIVIALTASIAFVVFRRRR